MHHSIAYKMIWSTLTAGEGIARLETTPYVSKCITDLYLYVSCIMQLHFVPCLSYFFGCERRWRQVQKSEKCSRYEAAIFNFAFMQSLRWVVTNCWIALAKVFLMRTTYRQVGYGWYEKAAFCKTFDGWKKGSVGCASNRQTQKFNVVKSSSSPMKSFCIFWKGGLPFSNFATGSNLQQVGILAIKVCFQKISKTHLLSDSKENRTNKTSVGT